jgi:hypothetical protein
MSTATEERDLTYGEIGAELIQSWDAVQEARETARALEQQALERPGDSEAFLALTEATDALNAAEMVLREYLKQEVAKADRVAAMIRRWSASAAELREEGERLIGMARAKENAVDELKMLVMRVMQELETRKVEGRRNVLRVQGNGGKQPVAVRQPELVPAKYQRYTLTLTGAQRSYLLFSPDDRVHAILELAKPIDPDTEGIRAALLRGEAVPGCVLEPYGEHLRLK